VKEMKRCDMKGQEHERIKSGVRFVPL
jgi:hypothetical protein